MINDVTMTSNIHIDFTVSQNSHNFLTFSFNRDLKSIHTKQTPCHINMKTMAM